MFTNKNLATLQLSLYLSLRLSRESSTAPQPWRAAQSKTVFLGPILSNSVSAEKFLGHSHFLQ
jgi:hypothetical protein